MAQNSMLTAALWLVIRVHLFCIAAVLVCVSSAQGDAIEVKPTDGYEHQIYRKEPGEIFTIKISIDYILPEDATYIRIEYYKLDGVSKSLVWTMQHSVSADVVEHINEGMIGYSAAEFNVTSHQNHFIFGLNSEPSYSGDYVAEVTYEKGGITYFGVSPTMSLLILMPPQLTLMINDNTINVVNEGEEVTLDCTSLVYYPLVDSVSIYRADTNTDCVTTPASTDWPRSLCQTSRMIERDDNKVPFQCRAEWNGQSRTSPPIVLNVTFPPSRLYMTQPFPIKPVPPQTKVTVTCETDSANPTATIQIVWEKGADIKTFSIRRSERDGTHHGKILISQLSFTATYELQGQAFSCGVLGFDSIPWQTYRLVVLQVSPDPKLSINNDSSPVISVIKEGQSAYVDCQTTPTIPAGVSMFIQRGSVNVSCKHTIAENGNPICQADVTFHRQENMLAWICYAVWGYRGKELTFPSNTTQINVTFASKIISMIESFPTELVTPGTSVSVTCETGSANPGQSILWVTNGTRITASDTYNITLTQREALYYGVITTSSLAFNVTKQHGGSVFECSINDNYSVEPQTSTLNVEYCESEPCVQGDCSSGVDSYVCSCNKGYTGINCDKDLDECKLNICMHGNCTNEVGSYVCSCNIGYTGTNCDIDIDECESNPCMQGSCREEVDSYVCSCNNGYTGVHCDIDIDECKLNPCVQGDCTNEVGSYVCSCNNGYTGINCDTDFDECSLSPCLNDGSCIDGVNGYLCECPTHYNGTNCELDLDECSSSPCLNNGSCVDGVNGYMCECLTSYNGTNCEQAPLTDVGDTGNQGSGGAGLPVIMAGVFGGVFCIILVVIAVLVYRNKSRHQPDKDQHDTKTLTELSSAVKCEEGRSTGTTPKQDKTQLRKKGI